MEDVGWYLYFMVIWPILRLFGYIFWHLVYFMVIWYIFLVLVWCTKNNLATLVSARFPFPHGSKGLTSPFARFGWKSIMLINFLHCLDDCLDVNTGLLSPKSQYVCMYVCTFSFSRYKSITTKIGYLKFLLQEPGANPTYKVRPWVTTL
jgi:hypothetical protein